MKGEKREKKRKYFYWESNAEKQKTSKFKTLWSLEKLLNGSKHPRRTRETSQMGDRRDSLWKALIYQQACVELLEQLFSGELLCAIVETLTWDNEWEAS